MAQHVGLGPEATIIGVDDGAGRSGVPSWTLLVVALVSVMATALVMYFVLRPDGSVAAADPEATVTVTVTEAAPVPEPSSPVPGVPDSPTASAPEPSTSPSTAHPETVEAGPAVSSTTVEAPPEQAPHEVEDQWLTLDANFSAAELGDLQSAPPGFQEYAETWVGTLDELGCTRDLWVLAMHPEGFVVGGDAWSECGGGGYRVIWSSQGGQWAPLFESQDLVDCRELADAGVPENSGEIECYADGQTWWY